MVRQVYGLTMCDNGVDTDDDTKQWRVVAICPLCYAGHTTTKYCISVKVCFGRNFCLFCISLKFTNIILMLKVFILCANLETILYSQN